MLPKELNRRACWGRCPGPGVRLGAHGWRRGGPSLTLSLPFQRVKQCVGTVTLDQIKDPLDITCNEVSGPLLVSSC